ncbi:hypothetical protein BLNAU_4032 [Blattamonas nauphoetae]|uniref:Uncharacterized protein n=1 Tax=Blattamonas nauphoetae TaxID=2049346 RepID=A0ABQ9YB45_9EUKA|nr:hypothetical protein BLNAU_4032 [Blattamonas nauphoetae]
MSFQSCTDSTNFDHIPDPRSSINPLREPFLYFAENTELSFEDKSTIYNSLVALVKEEYPFDDREEQLSGQRDGFDLLVTEREHTTIPKSHGVVAGGADSHHTTYPSELLLDRAPSLTHPRLLALPIPGIMQRKQVNSCSIVPLPHSSPIVGVADPWHYAAQTGELLLDRAPPSLIPDCWRCRSLALCSANR